MIVNDLIDEEKALVLLLLKCQLLLRLVNLSLDRSKLGSHSKGLMALKQDLFPGDLQKLSTSHNKAFLGFPRTTKMAPTTGWRTADKDVLDMAEAP